VSAPRFDSTRPRGSRRIARGDGAPGFGSSSSSDLSSWRISCDHALPSFKSRPSASSTSSPRSALQISITSARISCVRRDPIAPRYVDRGIDTGSVAPFFVRFGAMSMRGCIVSHRRAPARREGSRSQAISRHSLRCASRARSSAVERAYRSTVLHVFSRRGA